LNIKCNNPLRSKSNKTTVWVVVFNIQRPSTHG
jgi:hypothetical protein